MNSQEFLEILGDVDEKYVLAADENVVRPRFRWQPWAAAAACAALICVAAWPNFKGGSNGSAAGVTANSSTADCAAPMEDESAEAADDAAVDAPAGVLIQQSGLHDYFLFGEELRVMTTAGDAAALAEGVDDAALEKGSAPEPAPNAAESISGAFNPADVPNGVESPSYEAEAAIDPEEAISQCENLLNNSGINEAEGYYPAWYGGAWLDNDWPDNVSRLTVAVTEDFYSEALTAQIQGWCGGTGDVQICIVKYSLAYLEGLTDEVAALFDRYGWLPSVIDANEVTNRVELEIYGSVPSDEFLAELAKLDPEGDVIRVQAFTDRTIRVTDDTAMTPPAPAGEPSLSMPD